MDQYISAGLLNREFSDATVRRPIYTPINRIWDYIRVNLDWISNSTVNVRRTCVCACIGPRNDNAKSNDSANDCFDFGIHHGGVIL